MRQKIILHAGVHKTGTTSIQSFLFKNYEKLLQQGYYVPINHFTFENKATVFRNAIMQGNELEYMPIIKDILQQSKMHNCHTIILSDEDIYHFASKQNSNISILEKYFEVELVIYLRRPDRYAESVYGFSVQWHVTRLTVDAHEWLREYPIINYKWIMEQWENFFDSPTYKLRVYDEVVKKRDVVSDFIDTIGLDSDDNWDYPSRDNVTLNKYIIEFLRRTNHIKMNRKQFDQLKEFLARESSISSGPKAIYLNFEDRMEMFEKSYHSNRLVARKYLNRDYLFPLIDELDVPTGLSNESFTKVMIEISEAHLNLPNIMLT